MSEICFERKAKVPVGRVNLQTNKLLTRSWPMFHIW